MNNKYYDGTKILSMKDLNGNTPELFLITTNRTGGKTTYFNRLCINKFIKQQKKFALIYRFNYELDDIAEKFFKDIKSLFFENYDLVSKKKAKGIYHELFLIDNTKDKNKLISCGYALALNSADQIKKYSHLFSDVDLMLMDEFQSETNHYCSDEVKKLMSIHTSIARGQGKQVRYVPCILLGNQVSILNPYYLVLGITERLNKNTKFLRGDGWILESNYIETAADAQKESGFNRAFSNCSYAKYSSENIYLNDNISFIEKPKTKYTKYICTLKYENQEFAVKEYANEGIIYIDDRPDKSFNFKIALTTDDHNLNYVILENNSWLFLLFKRYFQNGCFRFKNQLCKQVILKCLSYK